MEELCLISAVDLIIQVVDSSLAARVVNREDREVRAREAVRPARKEGREVSKVSEADSKVAQAGRVKKAARETKAVGEVSREAARVQTRIRRGRLEPAPFFASLLCSAKPTAVEPRPFPPAVIAPDAVHLRMSFERSHGGGGNFISRSSRASTMIAETARFLNHFLLAGITNQGARWVLQRLSTSSYAPM